MLKNKPFWITLALLAVYLLAGFLAGPHLLQPRLQEFVFSKLGRELQFSTLRFDPITLSLELRQVELLAHEQSLWPELAMRADAVHIRFSVWRLTPAVADLLITAPLLEIGNEADRPYPFIGLWQEWQESHAGKPALQAFSTARWRLRDGQFLKHDTSEKGSAQVLLDQLNLDVSRAGAKGGREFSLDFSAPNEAALVTRGLLESANLRATGDYQLTTGSFPPITVSGLEAEGKFQAEAVEELLQIQLSDSRLWSDELSVCWNRQLLCAQLDPLNARFTASMLAGVDQVHWQNFEAELEAFGFGLSLGQEIVELVRQWAFGGGHLNLKRLPAIQDAGSVQQPGNKPYEISLDAQGDSNLSASGLYDRGQAVAEAQFQVAGEQHLQGRMRLQDSNTQQSQSPHSQLELQLENPSAGLAREFMDEHLSGQVDADSLGMRIRATQDDLGLELAGQLSLAKPRLNAGPVVPHPTALDPEWLLALWRNQGAIVAMELPQQAVDSTQMITLKMWLESQLLQLLRESSEHPFQSLARQVESETELPDKITFAAGSAATTPASDQAISALGTSLLLRPGLSLDVPAVYDPLIDLKALQTEQVRTHIALAGAAELSFQSGAEPTDFSDPVVHSVIDEFARQRLPARVLAAFEEVFGQSDVDRGILPEGDIEAYYAALFELLVEYAEIPQGALNSLARYRAQAVVDGLTRQGVQQDRLNTPDQAQTIAANLDGVPLKLGLGVWRDPGAGSSTPVSGVESWD